MIVKAQAVLYNVVTHNIGVAALDEDIKFSAGVVDLAKEGLRSQLVSYFLDHFKEPEFFSFTFSSGDLGLNPVYNFASNIFDNPSCIHEQSVKIARHLYNQSKHPNIKSGDLFVAYFQDVLIDDELVNAVAIFKSEVKDAYLKVEFDKHIASIIADEGTSLDKLDKACIIFNTERDAGFKIMNIDHSNRSKEAKYWAEDFLTITPRGDDYYYTKQFIKLTKDFVKNRMPKEFDADTTDQAAVLNRSLNYFQAVDKFDAMEYSEQVFKDGNVVEAFQDFKNEKAMLVDRSLEDNFQVSEFAVKKNSKSFKSILKLDKNFHVYIHGDQSMIEKGQDTDGRKFYKLYFDQEQ